MATPRVTTKIAAVSKTLADFPAYVSASEKLAEVSEQLSDAERELKSARESPRETEHERINAEAQSVLAGAAAVASPPHVAELVRRRDVLLEAVRLQTAEVDNERLAAARAITAEAAPLFRATVAEFIRLELAASAEYENILAMMAATRQACGGVSFLPDLGIAPQQVQRWRHFFQQFRTAAQEMLNLDNL